MPPWKVGNLPANVIQELRRTRPWCRISTSPVGGSDMSQEDIEATPGVGGALARFARLVRERFGEAVIDIRLFGSHARSTAHEESDVDVAVVLEAAGWEIRREIIDLAADIGLECDLVLSPTVFDRETWERWREQDRPLTRDIEQEGIRLGPRMDAGKAPWRSFRSRRRSWPSRTRS